VSELPPPPEALEEIPSAGNGETVAGGRGWSEIALRLATAAILIPTVLYLIARGGFWILGAVMVLVYLGITELYSLIEAKGASPHRLFGVVAGVALPVIAHFGNEYHATLAMTATLLGVMVAEVRKEEISEALGSISGTYCGVFYIGWLLSHVIPLRNFDRVVASKWGTDAAAALTPDTGAFLVVFAVSTIVACDAGAYFAGHAFGKRKLAPRISPGKTFEGAIGGIVGGALIALLCKALFAWLWPTLAVAIPWSIVVPIGVLLSIAGIIGDLVESMLKRDAEIKDAGALLPGMGGVLDRLDSALLALPLMYYLLLGYTFLHIGLQ
jgi:phosphatidate cytidylyltransferase